MNNKLTIANVKYRTLIKVNWTKQEQRNSEICWMNQFFLTENCGTVKDETSDIDFIGKNTFLRQYLFHVCRSNLLNKISSTEIQITILFTYQFK